jgi:hypothetical protein
LNTSNFDLAERYRLLTDHELAELQKSGQLSESAEAILNEEIAGRGLAEGKIDDLVAEIQNEQRKRRIESPPPQVARIWVGFLIAGAVLFAEIFDEVAGYTGRVGLRTPVLIIGSAYWLFCVHRFHKILEHKSAGTYKISPTKAVGFHLIPLFNIYWAIRWPIEFAGFLKNRGKVSILPGWVLGLALIFSMAMFRGFDGAIGMFCIFILFLYMSSRLRKMAAIQGIHSERDISQKQGEWTL